MITMERVQNYYRQLHKVPEQSGSEYLTSKYISQILRDQGYVPNSVGKTSVYADLIADLSLPWVLMRADMDALPVTEQTNLPFSSEHPGWMHACGHDSHCAMLLEATGKLRHKKLPHNIRFLFQSAEEVTQGALEAIHHGVIPAHLVACFAMHVWPGVPRGTVATRSGALMASSDVYRIQIKGRSAHCAQNHKGLDALQTAVHIAAKLPEIRKAAKDDKTLLFCGSIHSGTSHNIVPEDAYLYGTLRTFLKSEREAIIQLLEASVAEAADLFGTQAYIEWEGGCPAVSNSPELVKICEGIISGLDCNVPATLAGEDFAYYQEYAPGVMLWLGTGDTPPLHNGGFYVPEDLLSVGASIWEELACVDWYDALHNQQN